MNRNEFLIVTGLSGLVVALLILQIVFVHWANNDQTNMMRAQQYLNQGQVAWKNFTQVAQLTASLSEQKNDQALKDLLGRQQISIGPPSGQAAPSPDNTAPAPAPAPAPMANPHP
jgi:hypothetical protein